MYLIVFLLLHVKNPFPDEAVQRPVAESVAMPVPSASKQAVKRGSSVASLIMRSNKVYFVMKTKSGYVSEKYGRPFKIGIKST